VKNKDFIQALAQKAGISENEAKQLSVGMAAAVADSLEEGDTLAIQGFGNFEVKKKMERVVVNPTTKQRQLIPPKLSIAFKPGNTLKGKTIE